MRSREISSIIIIQNFAQLKALFKDTWETVPGNCDTFIYLGGNEQSTHKYVSELLGKGTIDKKSSGETKGRQGSSSRNYDVLGRELFTPDEVRKLDNRKCIIFIRGFDPVMDNKFVPFSHPAFSQTADGGGKPYVHTPKQGGDEAKPYQLLTKKSLAYYEELKKKGGNVYIDRLEYGELGLLTELEMKKRFLGQGQPGENPRAGEADRSRNIQKVCLDKKECRTKTPDTGKMPAQREEYRGHQGAQKIPARRGKLPGDDTIVNRMAQWRYTQEQRDELHKMMDMGMPQEDILSVFYPETGAEEMHRFLLAFQSGRGTGD